MSNPFGDLARPMVPRAYGPIAPIPASLLNIKTAAQANYASEFHTRLMQLIRQFESELDPSHAVGVRLVSFGQNFEFHLESMGYQNPSLITFYGRGHTGEPVQLIQHGSQISILLMSFPITPGSKQPIGFGSASQQEEHEEEKLQSDDE